ncbi:phosphoribosylformylglycinamidine cyclo-ligase [Apilactobacillus apinorum]|uniref:Phosphoribosylformylglycinamidine cyclo-ligase n=1 Tax=Apilactobacillus apinorum TaxID=1218495 RepID=A0ABP9ZHD4_9LACO
MADQYKQAGVDVESGEKAVTAIKGMVASTYDQSVVDDIGGFGAMYSLQSHFAKYDNPVLVSGTDGVGTKLMLAIQANRHDTIGVDLVAMCANDILAQGAKPLFFLDYIGIGKLLPEEVKEIVSGVVMGCKQAGLSLIGGEMAEMPGIYKTGDYDLSGFAVGIADKKRLLKAENVREGDILIGLKSSGIHSNGFSLVRKIIDDAKLDVNKQYEGFNQPLIDELLTPTHLYYHYIKGIVESVALHAIANITGGGIADNLSRVIPDDLTAVISRHTWEVPTIFKKLQEWGNLDQSDMDLVFNQGIGMILVVPQEYEQAVTDYLSDAGQEYFEIGEVVKRDKQAVQLK